MTISKCGLAFIPSISLAALIFAWLRNWQAICWPSYRTTCLMWATGTQKKAKALPFNPPANWRSQISVSKINYETTWLSYREADFSACCWPILACKPVSQSACSPHPVSQSTCSPHPAVRQSATFPATGQQGYKYRVAKMKSRIYFSNEKKKTWRKLNILISLTGF